MRTKWPYILVAVYLFFVFWLVLSQDSGDEHYDYDQQVCHLPE